MAFHLGQKVATKVYFCEDMKFTAMPSKAALINMSLTEDDVIPMGVQGTICAILSEKPLLYAVQIADTIYPLQPEEIAPTFESMPDAEKLFN